MVQLQVKSPSSSPKSKNECLIEDNVDTATPPSVKKQDECIANFMCILMGAGIIMCILFVNMYTRILFAWAGCGVTDGGSSNPPLEPLDHTSNMKRFMEYRDWLIRGSKNSDCGISCLYWESDPLSLEGEQRHETPKNVELVKPSKVRDNGLCRDVPLSQRFDCLPGGQVDQLTCESRGCCWVPVDETPRRDKPFPGSRLHRPTHGADLDDLPLNIPFCFYPGDYRGYRFLNFTEEIYGHKGYLKRDTASGYPNDVSLLKMEVRFETPTRIRIKILDDSTSRWESPLPLVSELEAGATDPLYTFSIEKDNAAFTVRRRSSSLPLFDTRNAAPLIFADQFLQVSTRLPSEYIYGLGEHLEGLLLDTFWKKRVLWNLDQIPEPGKNLYGSHPLYLSMEPDGNAHGVFLLNSNAMDIVLQPTPALTIKTIGGILDLYVFLGPTPDDVVRQYTDVVGQPFLPPYWSLGYHQCKFGYKSLNKTREVWQRTRNAGIPFDVQWNDIDYMDENKDFTYDKILFRELPDFLDELHELGMHYIPIVDPGISASEPLHTYPPWDEGVALKVFVRNASNMPFVGKVWNTVSTTWPDFTQPLGTYYWGRQLLRYHSWVAIDGAWIDMNEPSNFWSGSFNGCSDNNLDHPPYLPAVHGGVLYYHTICMAAKHYLGRHYNVHNLYGLTEAISTNKALQIVRAKRPFIISRSTFAGQGHYSGHWTGDVWSDWFNLWQSIPGILNFNMFGMPMVGADICGFNGNTTASLCLRWMQLGAFYPFSRNHNTDDAYDQDPVAMGEDVVIASRKALQIRYTLLPYLYSLFFKAHITGQPVARPLFFQYPNDIRTYAIDTQFLWGSGVMIAPVLKENVEEVEAYIPRDRWYDWYTGYTLQGTGSYQTLEAPKDTIPLLLRGGTVIPTQVPGDTTTSSRKNAFGITVALNETGYAEGEVFWDDGDSLDTVENMKFTHLSFFASPGTVFVNVTVAGYQEMPFFGYMYILGVVDKVSSVTVGSEKVPFQYDADNKVLSAEGFKKGLLSSFIISWK